MVKEITVAELKVMMDGNEDFQLVDVREPYEREIASIGGENIPLGQVPTRTDEIILDKKVIIYCRSGARSADAVNRLQSTLDTDNIFNLKGGVLAWSDEIDPKMPKY
jgi:rhodanese-related sulfurtransferase